jgi:hypothetical protein
MRKLANLYANRGGQHEPLDAGFLPGEGIYDQYDGSGSVEWYTPPPIFTAMGNPLFDLDPANPGKHITPWINVKKVYTKKDDGLIRPWFGFVFLNPPYGHNVLKVWVKKFIEHGNGIILVPDRTYTGWWQRLAAAADLILAINTKLAFVRQGEPVGHFTIGTHLVGIGDAAVTALQRAHQNGLGILLRPCNS